MTPKEHDSLKALERGQWQPWHIAVKVLAKYGSKPSSVDDGNGDKEEYR